MPTSAAHGRLKRVETKFPQFEPGIDPSRGAMIYTLAGDLESAIACFRRSIELNPRNESGKRNLRKLTAPG